MKNFEVTVYPFSKSFLPYLSYSEGITHISINYLVSPEGFCLDGKDASSIDNRPNSGYIVTSNFERAIMNSNTLLVPDINDASISRYVLEEDIYRKCLWCLNNNKNVLSSIQFSREQIDELKQLAEKNNLVFQSVCLSGIGSGLIEQEQPYRWRPLYRPSASVIFVGELNVNSNGLDVALSLISDFRCKGYNVSAILDNTTAYFFGLHVFSEVDNNEYRPHQYATAINMLVESIDNNETPDVIVVQVPGEMLAYSDIYPGNYGIYAYIVSQVITPDFFVCCLSKNFHYNELISPFSDLFQQKFGYPID